MSQFESKDKILTLSKTSKSGSSQVPQLTWYIRGSGNLTSLDPIPRNPGLTSYLNPTCCEQISPEIFVQAYIPIHVHHTLILNNTTFYFVSHILFIVVDHTI